MTGEQLFDSIFLTAFFRGCGQFQVLVDDKPWETTLEVSLSKVVDEKEFCSAFLVDRADFNEAVIRTKQAMAMIDGWIRKAAA